MALKTCSVDRAPRETPTATGVELETFRTKALELGHPSLATAALIAWEWLQREEHLFCAFEVAHYPPKEGPNSVRIVHPRRESVVALHDERGEPLFPELRVELNAIKNRTLSGLMIRRDRKDRKAGYRCRGSRPKADSTI
jgi:hypothetical protein